MTRTLFLLLVLTTGAGPVLGQDAPGLGPDAEVGGTLGLRTGVLRVGSGLLPVLGFGGGLRLSPQVELGAEVVFSLRAVALSSENSPGAGSLKLAHTGASLRWRPAGDAPGVRWGGSILFGAGTARVRSPLAATEIAHRNFLLLEPRVHILFRQHQRMRGSVDAGYRLSFGAGALPGILATELRGPTFSLSLQYVRRPWPAPALPPRPD